MPFILRAPRDFIKDGIRYDQFGDDDAELQGKREMEIRRLATALDVPPEVLLGLVGVNHWGAWQIEESALKTTITNLLELICWSLTVGYLDPALQVVGDMENPLDAELADMGDAAPPSVDKRRRIIWYDLSELTVRPDRSAAALSLDALMVIKSEATLRETGFSQTDLLTTDDENMDEWRRRIGIKLLGNPATVVAGLELLGIQIETVINPPTGLGAPEPVELPSGNGERPPSEPNGGPPLTRDVPPTQPPATAPRPQRA
jgi:hypothetical protein